MYEARVPPFGSDSQDCGRPVIYRSAELSGCGLFRYKWSRMWYPNRPPLVVIGLNPSTADHRIDDQTSRKVWSLASRLGCGEAILVNLGAGRATEPADWKRMLDPIGPENDMWIRQVFKDCRHRGGVVLAAWGVHGTFMDRDNKVVSIAQRVGVTLGCLGYTGGGHPRHPLYVPKKQEIVKYKHKRGVQSNES